MLRPNRDVGGWVARFLPPDACQDCGNTRGSAHLWNVRLPSAGYVCGGLAFHAAREPNDGKACWPSHACPTL
eukprot:6923857-Pyramimonas_sp.AAC.1